MITVDQYTDPTTLTSCTIRADGVTGRAVLFQHLIIDAATGKSRAGFAPGVVLELRIDVRHGTESRFLHLPYGATIDIL